MSVTKQAFCQSHHFAIVFEQLSIAFNTLGIFQQSLKTFQQFAKTFQQIFFIINIASKLFNNHNCSTIDKTIQHLNYSFQQFDEAVQQKHIFSTIVTILSTIRYNC